MQSYLFPILAAGTCALCNGTAAVLQKISADKVKNVSSMDVRLLWRLSQNKLYIVGVGLDIVGWLLTLYAVQYLPLFLVEAIVASSIVVTALIDRLIIKQRLSHRAYVAIGLILTGLMLLAIAASPERARPVSETLRTLIALSPVPVAGVGFILAKQKGRLSSLGLAIMAGLSFGATSVIGRIFIVSQPVWHTIYNPLVFGLIASGTLGVLLFSIALQRALATTMNATMTMSQTLIPAIVGIVFLGDSARNGLWYLVILGGVSALGGVLVLALGVTQTTSLED